MITSKRSLLVLKLIATIALMFVVHFTAFAICFGAVYGEFRYNVLSFEGWLIYISTLLVMVCVIVIPLLEDYNGTK